MRALMLQQILLGLGLELLNLVVLFSFPCFSCGDGSRTRSGGCGTAGSAGATYVRELDIISLLNAQLDPVQNQLVHTEVRSLEDQGLGVCVELLLPGRAEGCQRSAGERVHERSKRLAGASSLPDGDQLVLAALVLVAEPVLLIADALVSRSRLVQREIGSKWYGRVDSP